MIQRFNELSRAGRFAEAFRLVDLRLARDDDDVAVSTAEIEYYLGKSDSATLRAQTVLGSSTCVAVRARCTSLLAAVAWDAGELNESMVLSSRAFDLALKLGSAALICKTGANLLERKATTGSLSASLPLAAQVRRFALRSADPQTIAFVHLVHGRMEARAGRVDFAVRHFNRCRRLLDADENLWLASAAYIDECGVLAISGNTTSAADYARRGAALAQESGWSKGMVAAAANLAFLAVQRGDAEEADLQLAVASSQPFTSPALACGLADTAADAAMAKGHYKEAEALLRSHRDPFHNIPPWYTLNATETLIRLLLKTGRPAEALGLSSEGSSVAKAAGLSGYAVSFRLAGAEAGVALGETPEAGALPFEEISFDSPPALWAALYRTLGIALGFSKAASATDWLHRSARVSRALGDRRTQAETVLNGLALKDYSSAGTSNVGIDSAVALLEFAGHPHILGPEAFAILEGSGCTEAAALVVCGPAGAYIVSSIGWTIPEALAAASTVDSGLERLFLGQRSNESWTLVVRPPRKLDAYCTYASVRKLLSIALTMDGYRCREKQRTALWPVDSIDGDPDCIWASEQMIETLNICQRVARTSVSILITGETGTGKEMLARTIHKASDRADRPFLPFNCAAVPRDMLESQLFGYRKGAYTGADAPFLGIIRSAAGGTLFLDEIGDIGPEIQAKLLRFLDSHEIHPLGEPHPMRVDVRVIAATNAGVEQLVADGRFREDLFYRLNIVRLAIPPLRDRREEIPALVQHYLRRYGEEHRKGCLTITEEALEYLLLFPWPGNVRQLANEVLRIVAMADADSAVTPAMLSSEIRSARRTLPHTSTTAEPEIRLPLNQSLPTAVETLEKEMVRHALERTQGRLEEAARLLGISRKGLFLKRRRWAGGVD